MESKEFENNINLKELFLTFWRKKFFILLFTSFFALSSIIIALSIPNVYKSQALLAPSSNEESLTSKLVGLSTFASVGGFSIPSNEATKTQEAIARINSFEFFSDYFLPNIKLEDIMATEKWIAEKDKLVYDKNKFDVTTKTWVKNDPEIDDPTPSAQDAYKVYKLIMSVVQESDTTFIKLSVEHHSPKVAQSWVDLIIYQINESMRKIDAENAQKSISFLNESFSQTNVQSIKEVHAKLLEEQIQALMLSESNKYYVLKILDSPIVPENKSKPNRAMICVVITLLGGFISLMIVLLQNYKKSIDFF
ncbi:MAG: LPS O-antigen length regulator [Flavobacteriales bacterium]|nr:LPS O-antigen length regulator [Flavobacteriales bacterium]|tara:strand:+ start:172 stop:1092 length:921 start_codon:yes stop_codon:yes gene_type:complete